ncbi:hypothetical protein BDZ45DRAFT_764837 [Acephala macrosclerotiorum]|nr:hypothetical protein BDZ45DRAFT_764837 [Acephala macrosclerotiorum]
MYFPGPPSRAPKGGAPLTPKKSHRRTDAAQLPTPSESASTESKPETKAETLTSSERLIRSKAFSSAERLSAAATTSSTPLHPTATSASLAATQEEQAETLTPEERLSLSKVPISSERLPERMAALKAKMERIIEQKNAPLPPITEDSPYITMCTCILGSVLHDCNHLSQIYVQKCANWKEDAPCKPTVRQRKISSYENGACPSCKAEQAEKEMHQKKMEDVKKKRAARVSMETIESSAIEPATTGQQVHIGASQSTQKNVPKAKPQVEETGQHFNRFFTKFKPEAEGIGQHSSRDNSNALQAEVQREGLNVASPKYESKATQHGLPEKLNNAEVATGTQIEDSTEKVQKLQALAGKALMKGAIQEAFTNLKKERTWSNYHFDMEAMAALSGLETAAREGNDEKVALEKERFHEAVGSYKQSLEDVHKASGSCFWREERRLSRCFSRLCLGDATHVLRLQKSDKTCGGIQSKDVVI